MTTRDIRRTAALLLCLAGLHGCATPDGPSGPGEASIAPPAGAGEEQEPPAKPAEGGTGVAPAEPAPVVPPPIAGDRIDLETALGLAGADNPTIAIAAEAVRASRARLLEAQTLLLPTLDAGASVDAHDGNLLSARGIVRDINRESVYAGAGASAVGAGTVTIPGARITAQVADAVFEPQVARQLVASRSADSAATRNVVLLDVAIAYLELAGAEASLTAVRQSLGEIGEVARLTANFAKPGVGQGRAGDAERADSEKQVVTAQEQRVEEAVAVASAELARLLSADPAVRLHTPDGPLPLVQLVDPSADLDSLVQIAERNRPEVAARSADVGLFAARLRQEKVRPFVPFLSIGFSAGTFGGGGTGTDPRFGNFNGRTDFDALAVWSLDNLGFGNLAVQKRVRAQLGEAEAERARAIYQVRREVVEPFAQTQSARLQVEAATRRVRTAEEGYRLDLRRTRNLEGRPIEVLNSATLLNSARQDLIRAIVDYDEAQFRLFWALGRPMPLAPSGAAALPIGTSVSPHP
jgi:outer membrane protein TolC